MMVVAAFWAFWREVGIYTGMNMNEVLQIMQEALRSYPKFRMFNAVKENKWVEVSQALDEDKAYMFSYDTWFFHGNGKYSATWLHFDDGKLKKIIYKNYLVEWP